MTARNYIEFNDILSKFVDDNLRVELVKDVIFLSNDDYLFSEEERMNLDLLVKFEEEKRIEREKKQILEDGYNEGMQKGIKEGIEQEKNNQIKSFIKNLMDNNVSLENISLYCKLPIDEVKAIIDSLDI